MSIRYKIDPKAAHKISGRTPPAHAKGEIDVNRSMIVFYIPPGVHVSRRNMDGDEYNHFSHLNIHVPISFGRPLEGGNQLNTADTWQASIQKTGGVDHRSFVLPPDYTVDTVLTGKEPAVGEGLFKAFGEYSMPSLDGQLPRIYPVDSLFCSYPQDPGNEAPAIPCGKSVACKFLKILCCGQIFSAPHRMRGMHVQFGNLPHADCGHFICIDCLPLWHQAQTLLASQGGTPSATGSGVRITCFHEDCTCHVGSLTNMEERMRVLGCQFASPAKYTKSPEKVAQGTPVDAVRIVAPEIIDARVLVDWAVKFSGNNNFSSIVAIFSDPDLLNKDTDEWGADVEISDGNTCTSDIIFEHEDAKLGQDFADLFSEGNIFDVQRGCLTYLEECLDIDKNEFPAGSQIIVTVLETTDHPIAQLKRSRSEVKRAISWPSPSVGAAPDAKRQCSIASEATTHYAAGGASSARGSIGPASDLPPIPKKIYDIRPRIRRSSTCTSSSRRSSVNRGCRPVASS